MDMKSAELAQEEEMLLALGVNKVSIGLEIEFVGEYCPGSPLY